MVYRVAHSVAGSINPPASNPASAYLYSRLPNEAETSASYQTNYPAGPQILPGVLSAATQTYLSFNFSLYNAALPSVGAMSQNFDVLTSPLLAAAIANQNSTVGSVTLSDSVSGFNQTKPFAAKPYNLFSSRYRQNSLSFFFYYAENGNVWDSAFGKTGVMTPAGLESTPAAPTGLSWSALQSLLGLSATATAAYAFSFKPYSWAEFSGFAPYFSWPGGAAFLFGTPAVSTPTLFIEYIPPSSPILPLPPSTINGNWNGDGLFGKPPSVGNASDDGSITTPATVIGGNTDGNGNSGNPPIATGGNYGNIVNLLGPVRSYAFAISRRSRK